MSRRYDPSEDYRNWWQLGSTVTFLYNGERLRGEIVRTSSSPSYFHVEVDGTRYEVDSNADDMRMVW